jgi:hypothetical protein
MSNELLANSSTATNERPLATMSVVIVVVATSAVCGTAAPLWANAGPSSTSARVVAEPVGISDVRIASEALLIDLRPLETGDAARVDAVYYLQNDGPVQSLDLLFAFGSRETSDFQVTLDGEPIEGVLQKAPMPKEWMPPRMTPALSGNGVITYADGWSTVYPLAFSIVVPPGESVLAVRYRATAKHTYARPAMYRQFAYILAPARAWAGFGGLELTIHVPEEWTVVSAPVLQRDRGTLRGTFADVPADAIALTLRPPVAAGFDGVKYGAWGLFTVLGLGGLTLCRRWGGVKNRPESAFSSTESVDVQDTRAARPGRSVAIGMAYGALMFAAGLLAAWGPDVIFPVSAEERELIDKFRLSDGYGGLATNVGVLLMSLVAAVIGGVVATVRAARARRPESTTPPPAGG